jgi:hypothetical protein
MIAILMPQIRTPNIDRTPGSLDGEGSGDHDQPYRFGFRPRASAPYPFSTRQYARLLVLRSRIHDDAETTARLDCCNVSALRLRPAA